MRCGEISGFAKVNKSLGKSMNSEINMLLNGSIDGSVIYLQGEQPFIDAHQKEIPLAIPSH